MASRNIDQLMETADSLTGDEMLEFAQRLIERARSPKPITTKIDLNALAGTLVLTEDPLVIQERLRREWD